MKDKIYSFLLRFFYISLPEAQQVIAEKISAYDVIRWDKANVTRNDYCHYQLMDMHYKLYGYLTMTGIIDKYSELKIIPRNHVPQRSHGYTRWNQNYNAIVISRTNEPFYTGICIRKRDLRRYFKAKDKKIEEDMNAIWPNIKAESIKKIALSLVTKLKLYFQKK